MFTTQDRFGCNSEGNYLPEQMGNILPITARVLRAECSQNLQEPKKKSHANCHEIEPSVAGEQRVTRLGVSARVPRSPPPSPERKEKETGPGWMGLGLPGLTC